MATPLQPLAKCVLNYLYSIPAELLDKLRALIEKLIAIIDAQILVLRAMLLQYDYVKIFQEKIWNVGKEAIDNFKNGLLGGIPGPLDDLCPEFYHYFIDPAIGMIEALESAFLPLADKLFNTLSIVAYFDKLISYWEDAKFLLMSLMDAIDDAWFLAMERLGNRVP